MAILKPGFTPGFRGRKRPPAWNRRAHYLASEHDRESARLLDLDGHALTPSQAIESLGGPGVDYHEVIVAPSHHECEVIRGRDPGNPAQAAQEAGRRLAIAYAQGRPALLAIHEQDGRFHYHLAVKGPRDSRALGRNGVLQAHWDREVLGDEPRILDWEAHLRFKSLRARLLGTIQMQRENERSRVEAVRLAPPGLKASAATPYERTGRHLIESRFRLEMDTLQARYQARGMVGSPRHLAEQEAAAHRRLGALRRLEKRELGRELASVRHMAGRAGERLGRGARSVLEVTETLAGQVRQGLDGLREPPPDRSATRGLQIWEQASVQTAQRIGTEAAQAVTRVSLRVGTAALKMGAGLLLTVPSGGAELSRSLIEAGREIGTAGQETGEAIGRIGGSLLQGAGRVTLATARTALPEEAKPVLQASLEMSRGAGEFTREVLSLSPGSALVSATQTALRTVRATAAARGQLPEPLRRAFQVAGWIPLAGTGINALQQAAELAQSAHNAASRGLEMDR